MTDPATSISEDTKAWARDAEAVREVLNLEGGALTRAARLLSEEAFGRAVDLLVSARSHVIVTGMGKSGHIGRKIAATLASTGTPSFFIHPGEALHGDLGMLTTDNVVLALSQSGATEEILNILPFVSQLKIPLIAMTANPRSQLARAAQSLLDTSVEAEACPLNLAPTASTIVQLALGDGLAVALMKRRGFQEEDFAMRHPLGSLGRRLLFKVCDVMYHGEEMPVVSEGASLEESIAAMTRGRLMGAVVVVDQDGKLKGIFTDGDLRRLITKNKRFDGGMPITQAMIPDPKRIQSDVLAVKAVDLMETHRITVLPAVDDDDRLVGLVHLHDLVESGLMR